MNLVLAWVTIKALQMDSKSQKAVIIRIFLKYIDEIKTKHIRILII